MPEDPQSSAGAPTGAPGQRPSDGNDGVPSPQSSEPEIANPEAKKYADEAARLRVELKAAQKEADAFRAYKQQQEDAKLTADEKRDKALAEAQERASAAEVRAQQVAVKAEVKLLASNLGIKTELALKLIDFAEIEFDESGDPTNVAKLLEQAVTEYGLAPAAAANGNNGNGRAAQQSQQQRQQPTSIGSTPANPSRSGTSTGLPAGGWSWDAIGKLTTADYEALSVAERSAMAQFIMSNPQARGR